MVEYSNDQKQWFPAREYQISALKQFIIRNLVHSSTFEIYDEENEQDITEECELKNIVIGDEEIIGYDRHERYPGRAMEYEDGSIKFTLCPIKHDIVLLLREDMSVGFLRWNGIIRLVSNDKMYIKTENSHIPVYSNYYADRQDFFSSYPGFYMTCNGKEYHSLEDFDKLDRTTFLKDPEIHIPPGTPLFIDLKDPQKILYRYTSGHGVLFQLYLNTKPVGDILDLSEYVNQVQIDGKLYFFNNE